MQGTRTRHASDNKILDDFILAVDSDRPPASETGHVDTMAHAPEPHVNALVPHPLLLESAADARLSHQINRPLLEHPARTRSIT